MIKNWKAWVNNYFTTVIEHLSQAIQSTSLRHWGSPTKQEGSACHTTCLTSNAWLMPIQSKDGPIESVRTNGPHTPSARKLSNEFMMSRRRRNSSYHLMEMKKNNPQKFEELQVAPALADVYAPTFLDLTRHWFHSNS